MYYAYALIYKDKDGFEHPLEYNDQVILYKTTPAAENAKKRWLEYNDHYLRYGRCEVTYVPRKFWFDKRVEKQVFPDKERVRELKRIADTLRVKRITMA